MKAWEIGHPSCLFTNTQKSPSEGNLFTAIENPAPVVPVGRFQEKNRSGFLVDGNSSCCVEILFYPQPKGSTHIEFESLIVKGNRGPSSLHPGCEAGRVPLEIDDCLGLPQELRVTPPVLVELIESHVPNSFRGVPSDRNDTEDWRVLVDGSLHQKKRVIPGLRETKSLQHLMRHLLCVFEVLNGGDTGGGTGGANESACQKRHKPCSSQHFVTLVNR